MAVTLTYSTDTVSLDIVDNGVGFDISVLDHGPAESFGLNAIRRRVQLQGGTFDIESEPGHTAVTVTFPSRSATNDPFTPGRRPRHRASRPARSSRANPTSK